MDEDGQLIAAWLERQGQDAQVCTAVTDQGWSIDAPTCLEAPGALSLSTIEREHGVMVMYDEISVRGPVVRLGLLAVGEGTEAYALANILETGQLLGAGGETADVVVGFISTTGALDIRILADANPSGPGGNDAPGLTTCWPHCPETETCRCSSLEGQVWSSWCSCWRWCSRPAVPFVDVQRMTRASRRNSTKTW